MGVVAIFHQFPLIGILGLVDHFVNYTNIFLKVIGPQDNFFWNQNFLRDSFTGLGLYEQVCTNEDGFCIGVMNLPLNFCVLEIFE